MREAALQRSKEAAIYCFRAFSASLLFCLFVSPLLAQTFVNTANGTGLPLTIPSTGSGNLVILGVDSSTAPSSCTVGAQSATQAGATFSDSVGVLTVWFVANSNSGATSATCSGAGTVHAAYEYEYSGMITTNSVFDWLAFCTSDNQGSCLKNFTVNYTPSTANEAAIAMFNCQGSATSITGSSWGHTSFPSGEAGGTLTTSSIGLVTAIVDSGCSSSVAVGGIIAGFRASGGTGTTCSSTFADVVVSARATGTNPTASVTVPVHRTGDIGILSVWALNGSSSWTATVGSQTATQTSVSGTSSASSGQPVLFYILNLSSTGAQTVSLTTAGGATESQVAFTEFTPNPSCTYSHDIDSSLGTGSTTAVNAPSITPTGAGELLFVFTASAVHVNTVNSPWSCMEFVNEVNPCTYTTTVNAHGFITSASAGSTSNNMTGNSAGAWEALITSFTLSGAAAPAAAGMNKRQKYEQMDPL